MTDHKKFRKWVRELRKSWPMTYPVFVFFVPPGHKHLEGHDGHTHAFGKEKPEKFHIYIASNLNSGSTADTLAEEWAHCLRFHMWKNGGKAHDPIFSAIFGEIKRTWLDDDDIWLDDKKEISST